MTTNTFGSDAIASLLARRRLPRRSLIEDTATLQREPENRADPHAVVVLLEGERVAYLPGWVAAAFTLPPGGSCEVLVQLFTTTQDGALRAEGWAWLSDSPPAWQYGPNRWPALTREEKRAAEHGGRRAMVAEAIAGGGQRAEQFRAGMVNGVHYLELVEPIKQLKREGRLEEALGRCYAAIAGAEGDAQGREPAPFYTEQAAIVLRKLGRKDEEIAVLRRYLTHTPPDRREGSSIAARLAKLG